MPFRALDSAQIERTIEQLTTGLSRKIWQKLSVLYAIPPVDPPATAASSRVPVPAPGRS